MSLEDFQFGVDIMNTSVSVKTKKILAKTGSNIGEGQSDSDNVEWWQHVGFASRPANPVKGKQAAQAITIRSGTIDCAIASQDLRGLDLYGQLSPGETCLYATGPDGSSQGRILIKGDGSVNIFTRKDNSSGGAGMGVFVNADGSVSIASHNGAAILVGNDGSIKMFNGSGGVQVLPDGHIKLASGSNIDISGASVSLGGPSALPIAIGPATVASIAGLQSQITAIAAGLAALITATNAVPVVTGVHVNTAFGPVASALTPLIASTAAASSAVPSKRTLSD